MANGKVIYLSDPSHGRTYVTDGGMSVKNDLNTISWNTEYHLGVKTTQTVLTLPTPPNDISSSLVLTFTAGDGCSFVFNPPSGYTLVGLEDFQLEINQIYEMYFKTIKPNIIQVLYMAHTPPLPAGYIQLPYIESTGVQWIDTGLTACDDIEMTVIPTYITTNYSNNYLCGAWNGSQRGLVLLGARNPVMVGLGTTSEQAISTMPTTVNTRYTYRITATSATTCTLNRNDTTWTGTNAGNSITNTVNYYLFTVNYNNNATNTAASASKIKLYYAKMYISGRLIRNFVPCMRESDGAVGLYDLCESTSPFNGTAFYGNSGTGQFLYPPINPVYLYNEGDECTALTGGWTSGVYNANSVATKNAKDLYLFGGSQSWNQYAWFRTTNQIDLTNYSQLKVAFTNTSATTTEKYYYRVMAVAASVPSSWTRSMEMWGGASPIGLPSALDLRNTIANDGVQTLDISKITGSYYIFITCDATRKVNIPKIWLEASESKANTDKLLAQYMFANNLKDSGPYGHHLQVATGSISYSTTDKPSGISYSAICTNLGCGMTDDTGYRSIYTSKFQPFGISFWFKSNASTGSTTIPFNFRLKTSRGFSIQLDKTNAVVRLNYPAGNRTISNTGIFDNAWHHIVVTAVGMNSQPLYVYVDNVLKGTINLLIALAVPDRSFILGASADSSNNYSSPTTGNLAAVRIYGKLLSANDVAYLYNNGAGR